MPLLSNRDIGGPLTRSVEDLAIVYSVIAGYDPADPVTKKSRGKTKSDYRRYLKDKGLKGVRLGIAREIFDTQTADPEILELMSVAIDGLRKAGAIIIDPFKIPDYQRLTKATGFCSRFYFDLNNYLKSLGKHAPISTLDQIIEKKLFREQNKDAMKWAMSETGSPARQTPPCIGVNGDPRRKALLDSVVSAMNKAKIDAIIYPSWSNPPRLLGDSESPRGNNSPFIAPHSGQPAITVPMGFTENGLPAGLQLLARPFDEHKLIQYAYAYEQLTRHRKSPREFGILP